MINLEPESLNTVALTLTEKSTITATPVYYLFEFINDESNVSKLFTATDISTNKSRYNEFVIETTEGVEDLLTGVIKLDTKGFYKYNIYEQLSSNNLLIENTTSLVEKGKVYFNDVELPVKSEYSGQSDTETVYNG